MDTKLSDSSRLFNTLTIIIVLFGLYLTSFYNFLLFHSIAEVFIILVASGVFILAWHSRKLMDNYYLLCIGVAYLFVAIFELIHTLSYADMGIFEGYGNCF